MEVSKISQQQAIHALWKRGNLSFKYHSGQEVIEKAYLAITGKLFVALASRRLGKTYWAICKAFEAAIKTPKARVFIASAFQKDIEEIITPICESILSDVPTSLTPKWMSSKKKYILPNGSHIVLVGLDKHPNSLKGRYADCVVFDETFLIKRLKYLYSSVVVPMTMYRPNAKIIMISTPGESQDSEFFEFCQKAQTEKAYVELTIYDNPRVTPLMIEEYKKECLSPEDFDREFMCKWVTDKRLQITPEFNDSFIINSSLRDEYFQYYRKYISVDPGVNDPTGMTFSYFDWKHQFLVIEDEAALQFEQVTTEAIDNLIKDKEKELGYDKVFKRVSDSANKLFLQDLNKNSENYIIGTSKDNLQAMISALRIFIKNGQLRVSSKCTGLINQLKYGLWKEDRSELARQSGHHNDLLMTICYLIRNLSEYDNPIPIGHGVAPQDLFIHPDYEQIEKHENLKKLFNL